MEGLALGKSRDTSSVAEWREAKYLEQTREIDRSAGQKTTPYSSYCVHFLPQSMMQQEVQGEGGFGGRREKTEVKLFCILMGNDVLGKFYKTICYYGVSIHDLWQ